MALRRTGRRTIGKGFKRYGKKNYRRQGRFLNYSKKQGVLQTIPRSLYSQMPAQFRTTLMLDMVTSNFGVRAAANQVNFSDFSFACCSPQFSPINAVAGIVYPAYFTQLMSIYSRCTIDSVSCEYIITSTTGVTSPVSMCSLIGTYQDWNNLVNGGTVVGSSAIQQTVLQQRLLSHPTAKVYQLGTQGGGHDIVRFSLFNDNHKTREGISQDSLATTSDVTTYPPAINIPANTNAAPWMMFLVFNTSTTSFNVGLQVRIRMQATFQSLHPGYTTAAAP